MMLRFFLLTLLCHQQAVHSYRRHAIPTRVRSRTSTLRCESQLMGSEGLKTITSVPTLNESDGLNEEVAKVALPALAACELNPVEFSL